MKYEVRMEQVVVHNRSDGDSWESTEVFEGTANTFEDVQVLMGLVTSIFPNVTVSVTTTTTNISENENKEEN